MTRDTARSIVSLTTASGDSLHDETIVQAVRQWVETLVVDLNLCPFAKLELVRDRVRFATTAAATEGQLLAALEAELALLDADPAIETTLLIHPDVLRDFHDYNQFLDDVDALLEALGLEGVYQVASFHPDYQFGGTEPEDAENYTNRSPYPLLHLLREASLEQAIKRYPGVEQIPAKNIALMNHLGGARLQALLEACFKP